MSYATTYHLEPTLPVNAYDPSCCIPTEFGRVRSVAFIRKRYLPQILALPSDLPTWQTGISNGDIIVLPLTAGKFDSGEPKKYKGYGRRLSTHGARDMRLSFRVPAFISNSDFFDDLNNRVDYVPAFRSLSWLYICDTPADISTSEAVEDDLESVIIWSVNCNIRSTALPKKVAIAPLIMLFMCNMTSTGCIGQEWSDEFSQEFTGCSGGSGTPMLAEFSGEFSTEFN